MHDQLLVNVPILLRLATQKPLNLYSIDTVPMPFDTETLDGMNNEYTFINNSYPYMALNEHNYIPLTETQLRKCDKMGSIYYCQNSYVLRQRTQHTCESAIYYKMDAKMITKHCQAKFGSKCRIYSESFGCRRGLWFFSTCQDHGFSYVAKKNNPQKLSLLRTKL